MNKNNRIVIFIVQFLFLLLLVSLAYSGSFKLIKVNAHYEPELKSKEDPAITLPGTKIKAGLYRYYTDDGGFTGKVGFLINKERFYFLQSRRPEGKPGIEWQYGLAGDVTYGIYKNYFLLEASAGGTTRNSHLFLFKYDKNGVHFLDAISRDGLDFISSTKKIDNAGYPPWAQGEPIWMDIKDIDGDGKPEIKLMTSIGHKFQNYLILYLEIAENRLYVDFSPFLYKPLYEQEMEKYQRSDKTNDQYYIYGFLARKFSLSQIKDMLKPDRQELIGRIEKIKKANDSLHEVVRGERFILEQYHMQRR